MPGRKVTPEMRANAAAKLHRVTAVDKAERLELARELIARYATHVQVREAFKERFGVGHETADKWHKAAQADLIAAVTKQPPEQWKAQIMSSLRSICRRASTESDLRSMLKANEQLAKLLGVDAPAKQEIVTDDRSYRVEVVGIPLSDYAVKPNATATVAATIPAAGDSTGLPRPGGESNTA